MFSRIGTMLLFGVLSSSAWGVGGDVALKTRDWSFSGPFGTFDKAAMQRGFQVYNEVCAGCHSMKLIAFRNFADLGYSEGEIKALAAQYEVQDGPNEDGDMFMRPAIPADRMPAPYANDNAARAGNNGALPPDLSLIAKARPNGPNYLYSLLSSYDDAPNGKEVPDGMYYNAAYPGHLIAMPQPLYGDDVEYKDGTNASLEQEVNDLVTFLTWTSMPDLEDRRSAGLKVIFFLFIMTIVFYLSYRKIWSELKK